MLYSLKMALNAIMKMREREREREREKEREGKKGTSILQGDKVLSNCKFL